MIFSDLYLGHNSLRGFIDHLVLQLSPPPLPYLACLSLFPFPILFFLSFFCGGGGGGEEVGVLGGKLPLPPHPLHWMKPCMVINNINSTFDCNSAHYMKRSALQFIHIATQTAGSLLATPPLNLQVTYTKIIQKKERECHTLYCYVQTLFLCVQGTQLVAQPPPYSSKRVHGHTECIYDTLFPPLSQQYTLNIIGNASFLAAMQWMHAGEITIATEISRHFRKNMMIVYVSVVICTSHDLVFHLLSGIWLIACDCCQVTANDTYLAAALAGWLSSVAGVIHHCIIT